MRSPAFSLPFPSSLAMSASGVDDRDQPPPLVRVHTLSNEVEAGYLSAVLEAHGVRHGIEPFGTGCYSGVFEFQNGFGAVLVEAPDAARARTLIERALEEAALGEGDEGSEGEEGSEGDGGREGEGDDDDTA